jgi:hypothetical protein
MIIPRERDAVPPQPIGLDKVLLVEGETPRHFFEALASVLGLSQQIEIRSYGGVSDLGTYLKTIASTTEFRTKVKSLGIARDAESDPTAARESVEYAVQSAGISKHVAVRTAILPDNQTPGMIETLCLRSVDADPVLECANGFFTCLKEKSVALPEGIICAKHLARVYLAGKDCPEMPVGIAASKNLWPFSHTAFDSLKAFLQSL